MGDTTGQNALPQEPASGFEKTILEKGWVTAEQVAAAVKHQADRKASGESITLAQILLALNLLTKDQVREAVSAQGEKASLRCPTCRKIYTVWGYKPGSKSTCKTCKVALIPTGTTAAAVLKEGGKATESAPAVATASAPAAAPEAPLAIVEAPAPVAPPPPPAAPDPTLDPALVNLIPGYKIQRCLGSGAMGDVYLARQTSLDRPVAIKLLPAELAKNQEFVQRFASEARAAAKLSSHENIVAAVDVGEANGRHYFIMEMIEGATLQDILKRSGKLPEKQALDYAKQIAKGLKHAHQAGLIHRDIKPANIMIHGDKTAKICDFGLAREISSDVTLTMPGTVQSSPAYASPEQCRGRRDLDHRTDMYSLGVTLFELLTGRRPFLGDTPGALFIKHATEAPPSPMSLNSSITQAANLFVLKLLKKEPKARFDSYDQLIEAIDAVLTPKKLSTAAKGTRRELAKAPPAWRAKAIGLAAALLLIAVAGVIFFKVVKPKEDAKVADAAQAKAAEAETEKLLKAVTAMEARIDENPATIPSVRTRWKELAEQFKGTPQVATVARRRQEFDQKVSSLAEIGASKRIAEAGEKASEGRLVESMQILRGYPSVFAGTEGAERIAGQLVEVDRMLESKYAAERERLLVLLADGKADDARAAMPALKALVSWEDPDGKIQFLRPELPRELDLLNSRIDDVAKGPKPATPASTTEPKPVTPAPALTDAPAAVVKTPAEKPAPPPPPDFMAVLKNPAQRADPKVRSLAALGFRSLAARSAVCRAIEVYLMHPDSFWKVADGTPIAKAVSDYLASVPVQRIDTLSSAEHQGFFVSLSKKTSELGAAPKDVMYLFLLAHADELFGQNLRPDAEGIRLAGLQGAKASDFWGRPESVNRLALARLLLKVDVNPVELRRAMDPNTAAIDFPSRFLCGLATFRDKEFDAVAAASQWKRMADMMKDNSAGKYCDEVADRLKKASACDACSAVGKYPCKKCSAMGMADCDKCKGSGRVPETPSTSTLSSYTVPCPICKQKGKVICPTCAGARSQKCEKCDGKKTRKALGNEFVDVVASKLCAPCGGSGNVFTRVAHPCPDCDGLGRQFPK